MAVRSNPRWTGSSGRAVAVVLGSTTVRAVELEFVHDEARLLKRGLAPLPANCWENLTGASDKVAAAIRTALSAGGITATRVITALPRRLVTLKYAHLPHATPEQVESMVQFEAQQYIPFPLEEVVLDHQILSEESDELTTVMIVAARRTLVEDLLSIFDRAGLEVAQISVSALALVEHVWNSSQPVGLLNLEPGEMELVVVSDGRPLFTRATVLGKTPVGLPEAQVLAGEVTRSLSAYQNEYRTRPVDQLLLTGPPTCLSGVQEALSDLLTIPVERMSGRLLPSTDPDSLGYAVASGLALQWEGRGVGHIDLVPASRTERKIAAQRRVNAVAVSVLLLAVVAVVIVMVTQSLSAQRDEHIQAVRENRRLEIAENALNRTKTEHDGILQTYQTVAAGLGRRTPTVDVVKAVSDAVPKGNNLYLTQLTFERGGQLSIHGNALKESAAIDLVIGLQKSGAFSEVHVGDLGDAQATALSGGQASAGSDASKSQNSNTSFLIICRMNELPDKKSKSGPNRPIEGRGDKEMQASHVSDVEFLGMGKR